MMTVSNTLNSVYQFMKGSDIDKVTRFINNRDTEEVSHLKEEVSHLKEEVSQLKGEIQKSDELLRLKDAEIAKLKNEKKNTFWSFFSIV